MMQIWGYTLLYHRNKTDAKMCVDVTAMLSCCVLGPDWILGRPHHNCTAARCPLLHHLHGMLPAG